MGDVLNTKDLSQIKFDFSVDNVPYQCDLD